MNLELLTKQTGKVFGISNWVFIGLSFIGASVFLLSASGECQDESFCLVSVFLFIAIFSFLLLIMLAWVTGNFSGYKGIKSGANVRIFFLEDITLAKLLLVPIGYVLVLAISIWAGSLENPLLGIFGSGIIMMVAFLSTQSLVIPVLIHGAYNATVVLARTGFLSIQELVPLETVGSGIYVPEIGIGFLNLDVFIEVINQFIIVALAEEAFKVFVLAFVIVLLALRFDARKWSVKITAGLISVLVWMTWHLVIAIEAGTLSI